MGIWDRYTRTTRELFKSIEQIHTKATLLLENILIFMLTLNKQK